MTAVDVTSIANAAPPEAVTPFRFARAAATIPHLRGPATVTSSRYSVAATVSIGASAGQGRAVPRYLLRGYVVPAAGGSPISVYWRSASANLGEAPPLPPGVPAYAGFVVVGEWAV